MIRHIPLEHCTENLTWKSVLIKTSFSEENDDIDPLYGETGSCFTSKGGRRKKLFK